MRQGIKIESRSDLLHTSTEKKKRLLDRQLLWSWKYTKKRKCPSGLPDPFWSFRVEDYQTTINNQAFTRKQRTSTEVRECGEGLCGFCAPVPACAVAVFLLFSSIFLFLSLLPFVARFFFIFFTPFFLSAFFPSFFFANPFCGFSLFPFSRISRFFMDGFPD